MINPNEVLAYLQSGLAIEDLTDGEIEALEAEFGENWANLVEKTPKSDVADGNL